MTTPAPLMAELMYLNYVSHKNKVWQVNDIYGASGLITVLPDENGEGLGRRSIHDFEPIPLTEQWLKEFGFNSKGLIDGWYEKNILHEWVYILYNHQHGLCELSVSKHSMIPKNIKYVHQLRNLYFALTATKLERGGV